MSQSVSLCRRSLPRRAGSFISAASEPQCSLQMAPKKKNKIKATPKSEERAVMVEPPAVLETSHSSEKTLIELPAKPEEAAVVGGSQPNTELKFHAEKVVVDARAPERHWLFGYGSIVNETSRRSTVLAVNSQEEPSPAAWVELAASAGYVREWNFQAPSGFTAVGMRRDDHATIIGGVLFEANDSLSRFDARESGYERVELDPSLLSVIDGHAAATAALASPASHRFWTYVPLETHAASEEHPICQTYVDVCVLGCLERGGAEGGRALAQRWISTTFGWSQFWLNDAPMSRRPWLHRPRHADIDAVLREQSGHTHFDERRHPEEFSGRWMGSLRGMWGVPPRSTQFIGRDAELSRTAAAMERCARTDGGLTTLELVGMGGVGKTMLATEFCYRHFAGAADGSAMGPRAYGLVIWLRAETAEALATDLRSLAIDSGIGVQGLRNEEVVDEVRARLYRTRTPWLLVFDNVSTAELIAEKGVLPRGCQGIGHVLITSRELHEVNYEGSALRASTSVVQLGCLSTPESLALLRRVGGEHLGVDDPLDDAPLRSLGSTGRLDSPTKVLAHQPGDESSEAPFEVLQPKAAGAAVADKLGHLPLALALAAAYMRACDVSCAQYLQRLAGGARGADAAAGAELLQGYTRGVAESFELSLAQLDSSSSADEMSVAGGVASVSIRQVLNVLSFCASEGIPKALLTAVIRCESIAMREEARSATRAGAEGGHAPQPLQLPPAKTATPDEGSAPIDAAPDAAGHHNLLAHLPVAFGAVAAGAALAALVPSMRRRRRIGLMAVAAVSAGLAVAAAAVGSTPTPGASVEEDVEEDTASAASIPPPTSAYSPCPKQSKAAAVHPLLLPRCCDGDEGSGDGAVAPAAEAMVEAAADSAWLTLKKFSLLTVREVHGERTCCLHRLLGQSLRAHLDPMQAARVLSSCAWTVERFWTFDPADTSTWSAATAAIEHVQAVGRHTRSLLRAATASPSSPTATAWAAGEGLGGSEVERHGYGLLLAALQLRVSGLLTQGALCMSMALSRFEPARQALEAARAIQELQGPWAWGGVELQRGRALTLDTYGKVARYCGQLGEAEGHLNGALAMWRAVDDQVGAAATLHELGVVSLRRADWAAATALLQQSLGMKRARRRSTSIEHGRKGLRQSSEEAATLHQLAVAAMSSKPARLDEAERLLREALALEAQGPAALGGRAATLQQLARVSERRGDRDGARTHLQDALELHKRAYGKGVPHVNTAGVLSQLGSLSLQAEEPESASRHLQEALMMRMQIYGRSDHIEVALNLGKIGECERAQGDLSAAAARFEAQRSMIETLALREASQHPASSRGDHSSTSLPLLQQLIRIVMSAGGGEGAPPTRLLNQLLQTIRWQRTIAREMERKDGVSSSGECSLRSNELSGDAQQLQHAIEQHLASREEVREASSATERADDALLEATIVCRGEVRKALLELREAKSDTARRQRHLEDILQACNQLQALESADIIVGDAAQVADGTGAGPELEPAAESDGAVQEAALAFVTELREAAAALGTGGGFVSRAFAACDGLRSRLRDEGTALTDAQSEGAYQSRVTHLAAAGDYMLGADGLQRLQAAFGELSVDAFASGATALFPRFWSGEAVEGAEAVDAFAQSWAGERLLVHAPVGCLFDVIDKLEREPDASAVVVCPYWTGAPWFEPLTKLATDSIVLPAGSLRAVASRTMHVKSWRAVAFHVPSRPAVVRPG